MVLSNFLMAIGSVVIAPVSFLILVICIFSLFIFVSLAKGLSILLFFPQRISFLFH